MLRSAALPTAVGVLGNALVVGGHPGGQLGIHIDPIDFVGSVLRWTAIYFPATFVIEEVAFRAGLDAHVHRPGRAAPGGRRCSCRCSGAWAPRVADGMPFLLLVVSLVTWHCVVGVPLSFAWRRSGNLAAQRSRTRPSAAVRNGLIGL